MSESVFLSNVHHAYYKTDGTYAWPNSFEGDQLKQAKIEIEVNLQRIAELVVALMGAADMLDRAAKTIAQLNPSRILDSQEQLDMSFRCMEMAQKARR